MKSCCNASDMQEQPLTKRLDYVFGEMQRYHTQSDDCAEEEVVSSTTSEPCLDDDNYNEKDDLTEDQDGFTYSHDFAGAHVDPQLATLLNGPQWQKSNPYARRAARVDYSYKKPSQTATNRPPRKPKVCMFCPYQRRFRTATIKNFMSTAFQSLQSSGILRHSLTAAVLRSGRQSSSASCT